MSPSPDWYPDPTNATRLRYWDGVTWTQWVSTDGDTSEQRIEGPIPAPPVEGQAGWSGAPTQPATARETPAEGPARGADLPGALATGHGRSASATSSAPAASAPAATPVAAAPPWLETPATRPRASAAGYSTSADQILLRGGLGVAALGGIIATFAAGRVGASQGFLENDVTSGGAFTALAGAIVIIAAAALPWLWAQLAGIGVASLTAIGLAFAVVTVRTDGFLEGLDISLESGGWLLLAGSLVAFLGLALALLGIGLRPVTGDREPDAGKGVAALVLGIGGFPVPFVAPLGVAFGLLGMAEARAAGSRRGLAIAGFVVGLVAISLWALGLTLGMFLAEPSEG